MASFSAEMHVAGQVFLLLRCRYEAFQATDSRGRAVAKVRRGPVELLLDVPDGDFLLAWANDQRKRYPVLILFRNAASATTCC